MAKTKFHLHDAADGPLEVALIDKSKPDWERTFTQPAVDVPSWEPPQPGPLTDPVIVFDGDILHQEPGGVMHIDPQGVCLLAAE